LATAFGGKRQTISFYNHGYDQICAVPDRGRYDFFWHAAPSFDVASMRRFALKSSEFRAIFALNSRGSDNLLMISDGL
jgi:hypothetical protein